MKKRLLIIVMTLSLIMSLALFTACNSDKVNSSGKTDYSEAMLSGVGDDIYSELVTIGTKYKDRSSGSDKEREFAGYLIGKFASYGYEDMSQTFRFENFLNPNGNMNESINVIFKKDNPDTDKHVIITAGMDNLYAYDGYNDEGIYNGATSVAIMLEVAENLQNVNLPYDVYFVATGANSMNLAGSFEFYDKFYINHDKKDTLLLINYSMPVGGENMYMYSDEVKTPHNEFLYDIAKENKLDFKSVPKAKNSAEVIITDNQKVPYSHIGNLSGNLPFMNANIPTVNFVSADWSSFSFGETVERKGHTNIANTRNDNLDNFVKLVGEDRIKAESDMVYTLTVKALTDDGFVNAMEESIANMPDYSLLTSTALVIGLRIGISVIIITICAFVSAKLRKSLPSRPMEEFMKGAGVFVNIPKPNIDPFGDNGDSIFKGDEGNKSSDNPSDKGNNNGDDIFGI